MNKEILSKYIDHLLFFLFGACLVLTFYFYQYILEERKNILEKNQSIELFLKEQEVVIKQKIQQEEIKNKFLKINLEADSVLIQNIETGDILFKKNAKKKQPIASLTKLGTALVLLEHNSTQEVKIKPEHLKQWGDCFLKTGEVFNKNDLINFMLITSSNDATRALSSSLIQEPSKFIEKMNEISVNLGLKSTIFFSDTGLDITRYIAGAYSNILDINNLILYFYKNFPEASKKTAFSELEICSNVVCHQIKNTNILLPEEQSIVFSKTGYTNISAGNLAVIVNINNKLYSIIVLKSSKNGRFEDISKIIQVLKELN